MKYFYRMLLALGFVVLPALASAQIQLVNCAPSTPCTVLGPSATGTGDQAWLAFGKLNADVLSLQSQISTVFGGNSGGVYFFNGSSLASSATLATNALVLGGGVGNGPFTLPSLGINTTLLHGNAVGAPFFAAVNLTTDVTGINPVGNGGLGVGTIAGVLFGNGTAPVTPATAVNISSVFGCGNNAALFMNGAGGCTSPSGSGTVITTGSPASGNLAKFSGATSIVNGDLSGDCTTSGALVITCTKISGTNITLAGAFTTSGAFSITLVATASTTATLPPGTSSLGYLALPRIGGAVKTAGYTFALADSGYRALMNCASPCTVTINTALSWNVDTAILVVHNECAATQNVTIAISSGTLNLLGTSSGSSGPRTLAPCGTATITPESLSPEVWDSIGPNLT